MFIWYVVSVDFVGVCSSHRVELVRIANRHANNGCIVGVLNCLSVKKNALRSLKRSAVTLHLMTANDLLLPALPELVRQLILF